MPELPEVETIRRQIEPVLSGARIEKVWMRRAALVFRDFPQKGRLPKLIEGKKVLAVDRCGKYLLIEIEGKLTLMIHLGMSGSLMIRDTDAAKDKHAHLEIFFRGFKLSFRDPRMFGRVALFQDHDFSAMPGLDRLGPAPLSKEFNAGWLGQKFKGRKAAVKALLLDQSIAAGVGNIYSDEACHVAHISPLRQAGRIKPDELERLARAVKAVLRNGIAALGCTIRDYKSSGGASGDYQPLAYGREGRECLECGGKIIRVNVGNRSSFYCPKCQR
jgi:formamidopyrimidine-DNA glycosylase